MPHSEQTGHMGVTPTPRSPVDRSHEYHGRWKLAEPLRFLLIRYAERRRYFIATAVLAATITAIYGFIPHKPAILGAEGILADLRGLVSILFPFFVGALAAVTTFTREGLDEPTVGGRAILLNKGVEVVLTRRQFVCYIFGYCAFLSAVLFTAIILIKFLHPVFVDLGIYFAVAKVVAVAVLSLGFIHLLIVTLWGLYYLTVRLVR